MKKWIVVVMLFALVLSASAQEDALQAYVDSLVTSSDPGLVVLVDVEGEVFTASQGVSNIEAGTPVSIDDRFRIGSVSKTFVAVNMLQLVDEGGLSLDDTLIDWLAPSITDNIPYSDEITIRQLLDHTSGIVSYTDVEPYDDITDADPFYTWSALDTVEVIYGLDPVAEPLTEYNYSNTNYNLAHLIIEAASGTTLAESLAQRIFEPLGMDDSYLEDPNNLGDGLITGYDDYGDGFFDVGLTNDGQGLGDGGIISTAADMVLFMRGLFGGDLLSDDSLQEMITPIDIGDADYGLGINIFEEQWGTVYGHLGATNGFQSGLFYDQEFDTVVVMLTNNFASEVVDYDYASEAVEAMFGDE